MYKGSKLFGLCMNVNGELRSRFRLSMNVWGVKPIIIIFNHLVYFCETFDDLNVVVFSVFSERKYI